MHIYCFQRQQQQLHALVADLVSAQVNFLQCRRVLEVSAYLLHEAIINLFLRQVQLFQVVLNQDINDYVEHLALSALVL